LFDWNFKRIENGGYEILNVDEIPLERITAGVAKQGYCSLRLATLGDFGGTSEFQTGPPNTSSTNDNE
jgi:hypothetical protein